jgi:hypothetical protein
VTSMIGLTFLPVAQFAWGLLSKCSCCSILMAACPEQLLDKVRASPGVPPSASVWGSTGLCIPHHLSG